MRTLLAFLLLLAVGTAGAAEQRFVPYNPATGHTLGGIVYTNGTFTGNASGLTNANASALFASGTIPDARLPYFVVSGLLKCGVMTAAITNVARSASNSTITVNWPHGMIVGQKVLVNADDNSFDLTSATAPAYVQTVPTPYSFTYTNHNTNVTSKAATGTLTSWELVNDGGHVPLKNVAITAIASNGVTVGWTTSPVSTKIHFASFGNHQNNNGGRYVPQWGAVGATTALIQFRQRHTASGRVSYSGSGDPALNASWTKEGDTTSVSYAGAGVDAMSVGHSAYKCEQTATGTGVMTWVAPNLTVCGSPSVMVTLPNFNASPFTAAAYRPVAGGFYVQFWTNAISGITLETAASISNSPAGSHQFIWTRTDDALLYDHTLPQQGVTVFFEIGAGY